MASRTSSRRILLTGGSGYLGSRLIPLLLERGHLVRALARESSRHKCPVGCEPVLGNPLDSATFTDRMRSCDTIVQLVGIPKPAPWKGEQLRAVDRISGLALIEAARQSGVRHFVYVSVAHPAPIIKDYIAVRRECEAAMLATGLCATIIRPWYILGPGHWWPLLLKPGYWIGERLPSTYASAIRLGRVTIRQMLGTLVWAVEHPPEFVRVMEVPNIRALGTEQP